MTLNWINDIYIYIYLDYQKLSTAVSRKSSLGWFWLKAVDAQSTGAVENTDCTFAEE